MGVVASAVLGLGNTSCDSASKSSSDSNSTGVCKDEEEAGLGDISGGED